MKYLILTILFLPLLFISCKGNYKGPLQNGDIIFQTSMSPQSTAIQLATGSEYSHCGIIFIRNGKPYVYEAARKVKLTPLSRFIGKGKEKKYTVMRLKQADSLLTDENLKKMYLAGKKHKNAAYDPFFEWSDSLIYCSELVWKIYKDALGIEVGALQALKTFDLSHPEVRAIMKKRYGEKVPMEEPVISPVAVSLSPLLETVDLAPE